MIPLLLAAALGSAPAPTLPIQEPPAATSTRGVAGVCIRWGRWNRARVAEAVIVRSSGNAALDERIRTSIPNMDWPVGVDDYRGQWIGIWMAVGGAESPPADEPLPDCSAQRDHSWAAAPRPAA
jgi:hypothetical protein